MDALDRIGRLPYGQMDKWETATERFYDRSQQFVHVDSVALKSSGRFDVQRVVHRAIGELVYGGTHGVDYAIYEFGRGGNHDAPQRAMNATAANFVRTVGDMAMGAAGGE
jgi:hypothetical protein